MSIRLHGELTAPTGQGFRHGSRKCRTAPRQPACSCHSVCPVHGDLLHPGQEWELAFCRHGPPTWPPSPTQVITATKSRGREILVAPLSSPSDPHKSSPAEHWPHWFLPTSRKCHPLAQILLAWLIPLHPSFLPHTEGQIPRCYHTPLLHTLSPVVILHPACAYLVNASSSTRLSTSRAQGRA